MATPLERLNQLREVKAQSQPKTGIDRLNQLRKIKEQRSITAENEQIQDRGIADIFTGSERIKENPELGTLPEFGATKEGDTFKIAAGLLSTFEPKAQLDIIKEQIPEATFETTPQGVTIINIPLENGEVKRSVLNAPGFSPQDLTTSAAQVLSFIPAGRIAGFGKSLLQKAGIGAAASGATEQGLQEIGVQLGRKERDPTATAIATATGGLGEAIVPVAKNIFNARKGNLESIKADLAGEITDAGTKNVADVIQKGTPAEVAEIVDPNPEFFKAAESLGIKSEPIAGFTSNNPQFRDIEAALRKVPGSSLDPQAIQFIKDTGQSADDLIEQFGGTLDKAQLGLDFKDRSLSVINDLGEQADEVYGSLKDLIPQENRFSAPSTVAFLQSLAKKDAIPSRLNKILKDLTPKTKTTKGITTTNAATGKVTNRDKVEEVLPTLGKIDQTRREIGQAINKGSGPFKDVETGLNKALYARLASDQDEIAKSIDGGLEVSNAGKELIKKRKALEENTQTLLGKDLNNALNIKVSGAIKNLSKGEVDRFNQVMSAIPKNQRGEIALSAMNDVFKGTGVNQQSLNPTQFVKWFDTLNRSPAAKNSLFKALPKGSRKAIENLYTVSKGISRSLGQTTPTGRINALFNPETGFIRKMVGKIAAPAVAISTGSPTASLATNAAVSFLKQSTDGAKRASDLMASPEFQNIIRNAVKEGVVDGAVASEKLIKAEKRLARSDVYKKWAKTLSDGDRKALQKGLSMYLLSDSSSNDGE